jgi:hypothetical protein
MWPVILVAILVLAQVPSVAVTVDNPFPNPGDTITITVCVCEAPSGWNDSLWLSIDSPDGHNLYYAELGAGNLTTTIPYKIPQDATGGLYTVTVTWDHQYVQTGFTVEDQPIPEFPTPLVLIVATLAIASILRRQTSARPKTLVSHSRAYSVH